MNQCVYADSMRRLFTLVLLASLTTNAPASAEDIVTLRDIDLSAYKIVANPECGPMRTWDNGGWLFVCDMKSRKMILKKKPSKLPAKKPLTYYHRGNLVSNGTSTPNTNTSQSGANQATASQCNPSDQSRLRNSYSPVVASNRRLSELRSKLNRVNYLISQVGKNGPIQLPPSEYADLLAGYPVLANSRQVPISIYQAILQGSIIGEGKNYQEALTLATSAYSKASAGCKNVVGKP
jgi:hypothetical protein